MTIERVLMVLWVVLAILLALVFARQERIKRRHDRAISLARGDAAQALRQNKGKG